MAPVYRNLFNLILNTGLVPDEWCIGSIKPIFKNKGDRKDPDNYRGITLLSCMGKLFTSILNNRLNSYAENINLISEAQAGFRSCYSTTDHIFTLKCLVDICTTYNKSLFCCFVDYRKAFDTIPHLNMWVKLLKCGINGKIFNAIRHMYQKAKSCVIDNSRNQSEFFACNVGVRQGENLSPFLFAIYLNDMEEYFIENGCSNLKLFPFGFKMGESIDHLMTMLKLLLILYADDTVIIAETPENLQRGIDCLVAYCDLNKISVNTEKTKILIFNRSNKKPSHPFRFRNSQLEQVDNYTYLGIIFQRNGNFVLARKHLRDQAQKAMFGLLRKCRALKLPIDIQLELFDKTVLPIMLYGCEVWGFEDSKCFETIHLRFMKYVLGLKVRTPSNIVYGELGRHPIRLHIKRRIINYWSRLLNSKENKISRLLYGIILNLYKQGQYRSKWIVNVENILNECGLTFIWNDQASERSEWLDNVVKRTLHDQFIQTWHGDLLNDERFENYVLFKDKPCFENYLIGKNPKLIKLLMKFRCNNHKLPIEAKRYEYSDPNDRNCDYCDAAKGNEYHFLLECTYFTEIRKSNISEKYWRNPTTDLYARLMQDDSQRENICKFLSVCDIC
jgi:hypothetical protein